jgi:hypothetical protein
MNFFISNSFQDLRPSILLMVLGKWNLWCLMVYLGQSTMMCLMLSSALQGAHTGGGLADRRWLCVRQVWPTLRQVTTTSSWRIEQQEDLHGCVADFTSRSLSPCVWCGLHSGSPYIVRTSLAEAYPQPQVP